VRDTTLAGGYTIQLRRLYLLNNEPHQTREVLDIAHYYLIAGCDRIRNWNAYYKLGHDYYLKTNQADKAAACIDSIASIQASKAESHNTRLLAYAEQEEYELEKSLHDKHTVNESEELWLYRAGKPIQNLTRIPKFTIEGTDSTTNEYSLRFQRGTTSNQPVKTGEINVYFQNNAIIIKGLQANDTYLVYDLSGRLHATGKSTGDLTRIQTVKGVYVVLINGESYKVIVQYTISYPAFGNIRMTQ